MDADTGIQRRYRETIVNAMAKVKGLVLRGARYLRSLIWQEVSVDIYVREPDNIVERSFCRLFRERGYDYDNLYGEVVPERHAKPLGCTHDAVSFCSLCRSQSAGLW